MVVVGKFIEYKGGIEMGAKDTEEAWEGANDFLEMKQRRKITATLGVGKRRPKKIKSKRKKTKRRKTKKRFRKYKKKGGWRRSNYCMYKEPKGPGGKQERDESDCKDQEGCSWGIKLSPYYPIRGTKARCHKTE
jgi:hypothetical protein